MINKEYVNGYAIALNDLAVESNKQKKYKADLQTLKSALADNPLFIDLLNSGKLSKAEKETSVKKVCKQVHVHIINLIMILAFKRQAALLTKIIDKAINLLNAELNIHEGIVYSISKLSPTEIKSIEQRVAKIINVKPELTNKIDQHLIGGIRVEVNDEIIDFSLLGKLKALKQELLQGGK